MLCAEYLDLSTLENGWNEQGGWDLSHVYDRETMTWCYLGVYFEPRDANGRSLQEAAELIMIWAPEFLQGFGLPVSMLI